MLKQNQSGTINKAFIRLGFGTEASLPQIHSPHLHPSTFLRYHWILLVFYHAVEMPDKNDVPPSILCYI